MIKPYITTDAKEWNSVVDKHFGHPLQSFGWGEVKAGYGWTPTRIIFKDGERTIGGAQVLRRKLPKPFGSMMYVPRGPFCEKKYRGQILESLTKWAKVQDEKCVELVCEPEWTEQPESSRKLGWRTTKNHILLPGTVLIDLTQNPDEMLAAMPKTRRQDIKKYLRNGFQLEPAKTEEDFEACLNIYKEIATRDKFNLHVDEYYHDIWQKTGKYNRLLMLKNPEDGEVVAFQWALISNGFAFALFAGVGARGRKMRVNAGAKWQCMQDLHKDGIDRYDLNGLLNDGVDTYKKAFKGEEVHYIGSLELPLSGWYQIYTKVLPAGKKALHALDKIRKK